ncbi:condensation domain-containing protein [Mycobacterium sp. E2327]|uniref:condensation domain-containing protein n=1 Tax=Mycobacterium sp. E2327 TaxID=1834132 RepID=UPI000ACCA137|nr:condensation domain-containing protein [Mycobacterium sp. E2327]
MFIPGEEAFGAIHDWLPDPGAIVCWHPSPASLNKVRQAPVSAVPASHQQARHLRNFVDHAARGVDMSRLCIGSWDMPGRCDIRVLTYVINTHLRRHDTYHSWFEFADGDRILRHTVRNPADIQCVPVKHDEMSPEELREHIVATPSPLEWECFRFAVIQRADHFTFCFSIDHLYIDAQFLGAIRMELYLMYTSLLAGGAPPALPAAGSYEKYCVQQHEYTSALTLDSPQVQAWVDFFEQNDGTLPECPVSLGDGSGACDLMFVRLMDEQQTADFEDACIAAGGRFSGGVFASAALVQYELTGAETYYGLVACDTRSSRDEFLTIGWFTGFVPITIPVGSSSFGAAVRAAQQSFDSGKALANVPFARVLELAPWLRMPQGRVPLLFHLDASSPPLSTIVKSEWGGSNIKIHHDGGVPARFDLRVNRYEKETHAMVFFPDNPVARESVTRYLETLKSIYLRVAEGRGGAPLWDVAALQRQLV